MITSHYLFRRISTASISKKKLKIIQRIAIIIHEMELCSELEDVTAEIWTPKCFLKNSLTFAPTHYASSLLCCLSTLAACKLLESRRMHLVFPKLCVWSFGNHQGFMHGLSGKKKLNLLRILTWNTTEQCQKEKTLTSLDTHVINLIWSMIHWYRKEEKLKRYDAPEKYFICIITLLDRIWHQVIITSHPCKMMEPYSDSI
jgi:hypothetical protein